MENTNPATQSEPHAVDFAKDPERLFEAARLLANCRSYAYPALYKLLTDAGFDLGPMHENHHDHAPERCSYPCREEFPGWFAGEIAKRNYSYEAAADALNTSRVNVYRWKKGLHYPQDRCMRVILEVFGPREATEIE